MDEHDRSFSEDSQEEQIEPQIQQMEKENIISPIDKYRIYGKFPWQMVIQVMLILSISIQALIIINTTTDYCRCQERVFYENFISDSEKEEPDYARTAYLYSVEQLSEHLQSSLDNYFDFADNSLEKLNYTVTEGALSDVEMLVEYASEIDPKVFPTVYQVSTDNLGPFDNSKFSEHDIKEYIKLINKFQLKYKFNTYVPIYFQEHRECFGWEIYQTYDLSFRAHFKVELDIQRTVCTDETELTYWVIFLARLAWIHVLVIVLSVINEIITLVSLYQFLIEYWLKHLDDDNPKSSRYKREDALPSYKNMLNKWVLFNLFGNLIQILSGVIGLLDLENKYQITGVLTGFGCMFAFINICYYLDFRNSYSTLYATLQRALPVTMRFFTGLIPMFMGFVFFGICVFWMSERFFDVSSTSLALFSVTFGDSIYDVISDLTSTHFFIGQLYGYGFCVLFGVYIANIFMGIIQRAYVSSKMRKHLHWIFKYIRDDPNVARIVGYHRNIHFSKEKNIKTEQIRVTLQDRLEYFKARVLVCQQQFDIIDKIQNVRVKTELLKEYSKHLNEMAVIKDMSLNIDNEYKQ